MIGNRLPALDPKTAGIVSGQQKRLREDKGIIGNRIPSLGRDPGVPGPKSAGSTASADINRPVSPASIGSGSAASGPAESSNSPVTSRSSSPPTSNADEDTLPHALLSATLPDTGGTGAMTPSSTRADAGEDTSQRSAPPTPMQGPVDAIFRGGHYDLIAPNLKLAGANQNPEVSINMHRMFSSGSAGGLAAPSVAASLGSSRASQYDPSSQGSENPQKMMQDVSGISTPTGTPRAALKELDGSARGEGSVASDDRFEDLGELDSRLQGLNVEADAPDRDPTPEPPHVASSGWAGASVTDVDVAGPSLEHDPNEEDDLDDLKRGNLSLPKASSGTRSMDQNPVNRLMEAGMTQGLAEHPIAAEELKEQGGVAGRRMKDIETADEVNVPESENGQATHSETYASASELDVRTATASSSGGMDHQDPTYMPEIVQGARAAGTRLDETGPGPMTSGDTDYLKELLVEDRKKRAERDAAEPEQQAALQTEEDRDEGVNRREQLVMALDQNMNPDMDLQGDVGEAEKERAKEVTSRMTGGNRDENEDPADVLEPEEAAGEGDDQTEEDRDGARTPTSSRGRAEIAGVHKAGGEEPDDTANPDGASDASVPDQQLDGHEDGSKRPLQIQIEPIPIAQPAVDDDDEDDGGLQAKSLRDQTITPTPALRSDCQGTTSQTPTFPTPPSEDPDVVSPPENEPLNDRTTTDTNFVAVTPIDASMLKSFPDVPDEDRPRVQVHISSPHNTPQKAIPPLAASHPDQASPTAPTMPSGSKPAETPLAKIPGHSKSLSNPPELTKTSDSFGSPEPDLTRRDSLGVGADTPEDMSRPLSKRNSTRKSPKSPYLDDEDPGDYEPGEEGWATIHEVAG